MITGPSPKIYEVRDILLLWSVPVLDADETAPRSAKTVLVKISAPVQPVPPEAVAGSPSGQWSSRD
jgi:hypothetical protein